MKRFTAILMLCLSALILPQAVSASNQERCFRETGYCISGPILRYWERNGGLSTFGFPISGQGCRWLRIGCCRRNGLNVIAWRSGGWASHRRTPWRALPGIAGPPLADIPDRRPGRSGVRIFCHHPSSGVRAIPDVLAHPRRSGAVRISDHRTHTRRD